MHKLSPVWLASFSNRRLNVGVFPSLSHRKKCVGEGGALERSDRLAA